MNATRETDIIEFDDQEYIVSALGLLELEALETYLQGRVMQAGRASLPEDIDVEVEERMMQPVIAYAMNLSVTSNKGLSKLLNPNGLVRLFYHSLKRQHPDITLEKCRGFVTDKENFPKLFDSVMRVNGIIRKKPPEKHPNGPPVAAPSVTDKDRADRPVADNGGPEQNVRDATQRDRGLVAEAVGGVSESNGQS